MIKKTPKIPNMFSNKGEDGEIFFLMYRTISVQFMMAYNLVLPISPCLVKIIFLRTRTK